jgi:hypothetical protein
MRRLLAATPALLVLGCASPQSTKPVAAPMVAQADTTPAARLERALERVRASAPHEDSVFKSLAALLKAANDLKKPRPDTMQVYSSAVGVFSDSATHVSRCEPVRPGEDWRSVCVPKDQAVRIR